MENQPLVSVITITRNRGKLLGRCITSVLNQTYRNIEYIVIDGASDDNTDNVVANFNDSRLRYIKLETNWPIVDTINHGVALSNGKYITFLDSDDEYHLDKIEKQMALMQTLDESYGMVYCWMTYYDNQTLEILKVHAPSVRGMVADKVLEEPVVSGTPTFLFRRDAFISDAGWRDDIGIVSDWEMAARFCQKWKVDYIPESLINVYVNHGQSRLSTDLLTTKAEKFIKFHTHFLTRFGDIFERHPEYAKNHLYALVQYYSVLKNRKEAIKCYKQYLKIKTPFKNKVMALYHIIFGR